MTETTQEIRDFVIDRSKWRCGGDGPNRRGLGPTAMVNRDGFMCCLGHIREQLGRPNPKPDNIWWPKTPAISDRLQRLPPDGILTKHDQTRDVLANTEFSADAMIINDREMLTDEARERDLITLGKHAGLIITFTGEYVVPPRLQGEKHEAKELPGTEKSETPPSDGESEGGPQPS